MEDVLSQAPRLAKVDFGSRAVVALFLSRARTDIRDPPLVLSHSSNFAWVVSPTRVAFDFIYLHFIVFVYIQAVCYSFHPEVTASSSLCHSVADPEEVFLQAHQLFVSSTTSSTLTSRRTSSQHEHGVQHGRGISILPHGTRQSS